MSQPIRMTRVSTLETATNYVFIDGRSEETFELIAQMWSAYIGKDVSAEDVCVLMALLKIARLKQNPTQGDNWIDLAGYAACGAELATSHLPEP